MLETEKFVSATIEACKNMFDTLISFSLSEDTLQKQVYLKATPGDLSQDIVASMMLSGQNIGAISFYMPYDLALFILIAHIEQGTSFTI